MSALVSGVVMDGIEYSVIVEDGMVVGFRRYHAFNKGKGMWVELRFSEDERVASDAEAPLLDRMVKVALLQLIEGHSEVST